MYLLIHLSVNSITDVGMYKIKSIFKQNSFKLKKIKIKLKARKLSNLICERCGDSISLKLPFHFVVEGGLFYGNFKLYCR